MIELNVPYTEKNLVKRLGAKWHPGLKKWFITSDMNAQPFYRWLPETTLDFIKQQSLDLDDVIPGTLDKPYSLTLFVNEIKNVIVKEYIQPIWVIVEISELKIYNQNLFLTLVEYDKDGALLVRARGVIWNYVNIINTFLAATNIELKSGIKVLAQITVDYHMQYGLTLIINNLDPSYTVGEAQAKLLKIKQQLLAEGIFFNNKNLSLPEDYTKIAVISPKEAAGLGDFKQDALILQNYEICYFDYYVAVFQGTDTTNSMVDTLTKILNSSIDYDAIVIIRGGGASSDLTWLNDYAIAKTICLAKIPIFSGIGHNKDQTIIDQVARQSFDTPSKVIAFLINSITTNAEHANNNFMFVQQYSYNIFNQYTKDLQNIFEHIKAYTINQVQHMQGMLEREFLDLPPIVKQRLTALSELLDAIMQQILCLSPEKILQRGFTIAYSNNSNKMILTSKQIAEHYNRLILKFHDGEIEYEKS